MRSEGDHGRVGQCGHAEILKTHKKDSIENSAGTPVDPWRIWEGRAADLQLKKGGLSLTFAFPTRWPLFPIAGKTAPWVLCAVGE